MAGQTKREATGKAGARASAGSAASSGAAGPKAGSAAAGAGLAHGMGQAIESPNSTVDRALRVLETFLGQERDLGVLELSRQLGLDKSVIHRILVTLTGRHFLEQDPITRRYRVGLRVWELGQRFWTGQVLKEIALRELRTLIDERPYSTGFLGELDNGDIVVLSSTVGPGPLSITINPGTRLMAELTTTGRTMLAQLGPAQAEQIILERRSTDPGRPFPPLGDLMADLADIRQRGYGLASGHYSPGIGTVARVVHDSAGQPVLTLTIDYLLGEETETFATTLPAELATCANEIERLAATMPE